MEKITPQTTAYLVGGGIASLACAVFLIRDGKMPGENITIFEKSEKMGGSLDAQVLHKNNYFMRGFRAYEEKMYACMLDLFSFIPSLNTPQKTITEEFFEFNTKNKIYSRARLIKNGKRISTKSLGLTFRDKSALLKLLFTPENYLGALKLEDYFSPLFFKSKFWLEFCTSFSFLPWHSLIEFKRYSLRLMQDVPFLDGLNSLKVTPFNQYDSIVTPILSWLKTQKVNFKFNFTIDNISFKIRHGIKTADKIYYRYKSREGEISIKKNYVFITLGSMTENSSIGSMRKPPTRATLAKSASWQLWENIAKKNPDFGNPAAFTNDIDKSKWISFTITSQGKIAFKPIHSLVRKESSVQGPTTITDSNWLMTIGIPHQPFFINQPKGITVWWGYGLYPDRKGNHVQKKMSQCNGEEILTEICQHIKFNKRTKNLIEGSTCIPCMMPYITSQFLPRKKGDRPQIVPANASNFAFLGQFCEIQDDIVFTMEYSVRTAQIAVYKLLRLNKEIPPIYRGWHHAKIIYNAIRTFFR